MSSVLNCLKISIGISLLLLACASASAQPPQPPVTAAQKTAIVDSAARIYIEQYVFPDVGKKMADRIRKQNKQGAYKDITLLREFTERLTEDLRSVSHDLHIRMLVAPPEPQGEAPEDSVAQHEREVANARRFNFGFQKVECMRGNIGYLKLNQFYAAEDAGATAIAAMNFLGHCDALIFDLRDNGGGDPSMIQLLTSYLYEEPKFLNMFEVRDQERPDQFWSLAYVPGPRLPRVPVFVLTSDNTFSGAEEFSYNLKNLKRATIVGDTTGGGAHPCNFIPIRSLGVAAIVPYGRAVNPITGTNWEGTGVYPDIVVPQEQALDVAHLEALKPLYEKETDPMLKNALEWLVVGLEAKLRPVQLSPYELQPFVGTYGPRVITLENDTLYYQRGENAKHRLIPFGKNIFGMDDLDYFRVKFTADASGQITEIIGCYDNGMTDRNARDQ